MAVLLALLASVCGGLADFAGGAASRRLPAVVVDALSQLAGLTTAVAVLLVAWPGSATSLDLLWAVGAGVCMMLGLVAFYSALSTGTMGVVLHERMRRVQQVGAAVAFVGVAMLGFARQAGIFRAPLEPVRSPRRTTGRRRWRE